MKFYYNVINLKDHKLSKSRNFRLPRRKKAKLSGQYFYKNTSRARM